MDIYIKKKKVGGSRITDKVEIIFHLRRLRYKFLHLG